MPHHPALAAGRTAVITGGASGIGLAAAKRYAAFGMKVVIADLRQEALEAAAKEIAAVPGSPGEVLTVAGSAGFDVIGAGHVSTGNPTSWLLRQEMSAVLDWARSYDVVLIDGPASPLHADAGWLTSKADAVLLCASLGQSATGSLVAAASAIRRLGGRIGALAVRQLDTDDFAADLAAAERYNRVG